MTVFNRTDKPAEGIAPAMPQMQPRESVEAPSAQPTPVPMHSETRRAPVHTSSPASGTSVISRSLKITGQLESTEDIQIDGEIDGDVRGVTIKVGSSAKVKGAVYGDEVEVAGTVEGKIEAKTVILTSTGRMTGDVIHQDITIQSGAFIDGHIRPEQAKPESRKVIPVHKTASGLRETLEQK